MRLADRIALVTGAGSGIGRAIALRFAQEGARVVVNDVKAEAAQATVDAIAAGSEAPRGRAVVADVSDSGQVRRMFEEVDRELGALDILVNNAGIAEGAAGDRERIRVTGEARLAELMGGGPVTTHWDLTQEMSDEAWHRMIGVHLNGTFFCTREALRLMARRNRGVIINMSSVAALMGLEAAPHYSAAKGGILAFTRALSREVASRGIRVNAICPGYIDTEINHMQWETESGRRFIESMPRKRIGSPADLDTTLLMLCANESHFINGAVIAADDGFGL